MCVTSPLKNPAPRTGKTTPTKAYRPSGVSDMAFTTSELGTHAPNPRSLAHQSANIWCLPSFSLMIDEPQTQ
ncbi:MAG: hypothetical protein LBQ60_09380 [Bacteroidales bacterium]|nr:hypothetical protein [Bacteroidales bacterium]